VIFKTKCSIVILKYENSSEKKVIIKISNLNGVKGFHQFKVNTANRLN